MVASKWQAVAFAAVVAVGGARAGSAAVLAVGDGSFENRAVPTSGGNNGYSQFPSDAANVFGAWETVNGTNSEFTATLRNSAYGNYPNADGAQTGDIGAGPNAVGGATFGIFEDLTNYTTPDPTLLWTAGQRYTMTVAVGSRAGSAVPATAAPLDLRLFYRPADQGAANVIADTLVPAASVNTATLTDFTVTFTANPGDAEIGKPIDVWLVPSAARVTGGDWVVDNVRLSSVSVPEPTGLAAVAAAGLLAARRRRRA